MAFSLKKWVTGMLESTRLNDTNTNWTDIESAIDTLQTNASLLWTGTGSQTYLDVIADNLPSLPANRTSVATVSRGNIYGAVILKRNNTNCKAIIMPHFGTQVTVAVMTDGIWEDRAI
jgi:hypothetical protein